MLLCIDAIGLRPQIQQMADRIAGWGHVVLAPNLLYRSGSAAQTTPEADLRLPGERERFFVHAMRRVRSLTPERLAQDLPIYLATLRGLPGVGPGPVGATGYCMGARAAVRAACLDPGVGAVGAFHGGGLATEAEDSPHLLLPMARAEFVFGHADADPSMGAEAVARLGKSLTAAGLVATNEVYPGAAHGYTMADSSAYDAAATERHFHELEALFARML